MLSLTPTLTDPMLIVFFSLVVEIRAKFIIFIVIIVIKQQTVIFFLLLFFFLNIFFNTITLTILAFFSPFF